MNTLFTENDLNDMIFYVGCFIIGWVFGTMIGHALGNRLRVPLIAKFDIQFPPKPEESVPSV